MEFRANPNWWLGLDPPEGTTPSGEPSRASSEAREGSPAEPVSWPIRWSLYAFVFSILFESLPMGLPLEMTELTGAAVLLSTLSQPRLFLRRPPAAVLGFIAYLYLCIAILFLQGFSNAAIAIPQLDVLTRLLVFFWIAYCAFRDERTARGAIVSLILSCLLLAVLQMLGLTTTTVEALSRSDRISVYGLDPNQLAGVLSLGLIGVLGFTYGLRRALIRPSFLVWPVFGLIGMTVVKTGSRGGMLSLAVGLIVLMMGRGSIGMRVRNVGIVLLGVGFFFVVTYRTESTRERFAQTIASGSMTGRERIYPATVQMFLERPILGWGPYMNTYEIQRRVRLPGYPRLTAHNLVLYVLTATGLVGAIPFFLGTGLCVWAAWRGRNGPHGILPLALILAILVADMSVDGLHWKQHWFVMAYALASGTWIAAAAQARNLPTPDTGASLALDPPTPWDLNLSPAPRGLALDPPDRGEA